MSLGPISSVTVEQGCVSLSPWQKRTCEHSIPKQDWPSLESSTKSSGNGPVISLSPMLNSAKPTNKASQIVNRLKGCHEDWLEVDVLRFSNLLELKSNGRLPVNPFPLRFKVPLPQKQRQVSTRVRTFTCKTRCTNTYEVESAGLAPLEYSLSCCRYCSQLSIVLSHEIEVLRKEGASWRHIAHVPMLFNNPNSLGISPIALVLDKSRYAGSATKNERNKRCAVEKEAVTYISWTAWQAL